MRFHAPPLLYADQMVLWFSIWLLQELLFRRQPCSRNFPSSAAGSSHRHYEGLTTDGRPFADGPDRGGTSRTASASRASKWTHFPSRSHSRAARAQEEDGLRPAAASSEALYDADGATFQLDDGVRRDSSMESLAKAQAVLRPQVRQT